MAVQYQTDLATSGNQQSQIDLLTQLNTFVSSIAGSEGTENSTLSSILTALGSQATAANQTAASAILTSILAALATAATATKQDTGNSSLASIDTKLSGPSAAAITSVNQTTSSQSVLPANAARKGLYLYNNSGQKAYVAFGATASSSAFTFLLPANSGYESPQAKVYTGALSIVFGGAGGGNLQITELT